MRIPKWLAVLCSILKTFQTFNTTTLCRWQLRTKWIRFQHRMMTTWRRKWSPWPETRGRFTSLVSSQPLWVLVSLLSEYDKSSLLALLGLTGSYVTVFMCLYSASCVVCSRAVWGQECKCCLCLIKASSCWRWWGVARLLRTTSECWGPTGEPQTLYNQIYIYCKKTCLLNLN